MDNLDDDPFFVDLSELDNAYGADCGAPPLAIHSIGPFCDTHDNPIAPLSPSSDTQTSPAGSSPDHSPSRPKKNKRIRNTRTSARKRVPATPPPSPIDVQPDRVDVARGALYNLYSVIQRERAETFQALAMLANENRRLANSFDVMARHNADLAARMDLAVKSNIELTKHVIVLASAVRGMSEEVSPLWCHESFPSQP
jgi:hypothetical protein